MTRRWAMAVDTRRCVGCAACVIACKTENAVPAGGFRCWTVQETSGVFPELALEVRSERCNHCARTPCVSACPTGASFVAEGGIVAVDARKCTGCKACVASCPYGARFVHPEGHVDKCTFCLHRVRRGAAPACVENCPTSALAFGDLSEPESPVSLLVRTRRARTLRPEAGTEPRVFFLESGRNG
jgi:Fe-S-cluster-containing dehydrogenase component